MQVVLYSRSGCHLCDDARTVLVAEQAHTPFDLEEVDIETDDSLISEYGLRIPVVVVDGEEAFEYTVDADELAERLRP